MAKTARDVLENLTKINNIKYNNNNNNTNFVSDENKVEVIETSSFSGLASRETLAEALASRGTLPAKWRGVKLDLFANPALTLKITIIRHDSTKFACSSQLNSPRTHVFRGKEQGQGSAYHWRLVEYLMELRDDYDYRISKVSRPRKGGTISDFVSLIYQQQQLWNCDLVFDHRIYSFVLDKPVSDAFVKSKGIATGYQGVTGYTRPWATSEELGI